MGKLWKNDLLLRNQRFHEFMRFCVVGVVATAVHYGLYLLLIRVFAVSNNWWANVAYSIGYLMGFVCNLWLSACFTFKKEITAKRGIGFAVSNIINYCLHMGFLNMFLWIGLPEQWAPVPVYCIVIPINFILVRFVFKRLD